MRKIIICIPLLFLSLVLFAQKEDFNWILGSVNYNDSLFATANINFNVHPPVIEYIDKRPGFNFVSSSLSDSTGDIICFTNGVNIYNNKFEAIENGNDMQDSDDYPFGFIGTQSTIILPVGHQEFVLISGKIKYYNNAQGGLLGGFLPVFFYKFNFEVAPERGEVIVRESPVFSDTVNFHGMTAVRHANGRDWWVTLIKNDSNKYYKLLVTSRGAEVYDYQKIGKTISPGWDHAVFSPDGKWYIRYSWWGNTITESRSSIYLYNFDRCSGTLSNFQSYELKDNGPGGVAVSPNSRYLYVSNWDTIFQYDLKAPNIFETETIVAAYDGFKGEDGRPVRFFTPQLAPDNRIYLCVPNVPSRYLHYIEYPDSAGLACKVVQHGMKLPVYNSNTLPNLPYFRLYEEKGGPCDTIWEGEPDDFTRIKIQPNPGSDEVLLSMPGDGLPYSGTLRMYTATGTMAVQMEVPLKTQFITVNTTTLANGLYFYELSLNGKQIALGKWVKWRN